MRTILALALSLWAACKVLEAARENTYKEGYAQGYQDCEKSLDKNLFKEGFDRGRQFERDNLAMAIQTHGG